MNNPNWYFYKQILHQDVEVKRGLKEYGEQEEDYHRDADSGCTNYDSIDDSALPGTTSSPADNGQECQDRDRVWSLS